MKLLLSTAEARKTVDLTHTGEKSRGTTQRFPVAGGGGGSSVLYVSFVTAYVPSSCQKQVQIASDEGLSFLYLARHIQIGRSTPFPMPKSICNSER